MMARPLAGTPRPYAFPSSVTHVLSNGLRVIVAPMHRLPLVSVMAVVDAGASDDPVSRDGLALLAASALAEGTIAREGPALAEAFERLGTSVHSGADWDSASASLTVTAARLDDAFALLSEVLIAPRFAVADIERLKAERLADILQQRVEPRGLADEQFARVVYDGTSRYAREEGGTPETVRALDADLLRAWHDTKFGSTATTIIVAGDVTPEHVLRLVEQRLGGWSRPVPPPSVVATPMRFARRGVHVVDKRDAPQTELRVGHVGLPRGHQDYFKVVVMNAVLGGLFSSRINLNLREAHAYTYGAFSSFDWRRAAGPFTVATAVKTEVTDAAAREILAEIDRMRAERVRSDELELATKYLAGVFPIRYETTGAVASALAVATVYGLPEDYFTTYRERISAVTADDVLDAAQTHLRPDVMQVLAVGDASTITEPLTALGVGVPDLIDANNGDRP